MSEQPAPVLTYAPPPRRRSYGAAWVRAIVTVVGTATLFAIGGGCLGFAIGLVSPSYYRTVFPTASANPFFSPAEVGFGLGMGQGAAMGVWAGIAIAGILAWRETRLDAGQASI